MGRTSAFATELRRHRELAGLTQAELAERAGLGERTVSNLERGVNTTPYPSTVRLLADALDLSPDRRARLVAAARGGAVSPALDDLPTGGYLGAAPSAPLVARDAERAAIVSAVEDVAKGATRVVLLAGEPGIGKTRLAQEASLLARDLGFQVATGRCYQQQRETPFAPWLEAFGILHGTAPQSVRDSIAERWPPLVTLLPDQLVSMPPSGSAPDPARRLYRAATGFIRELAVLRPVAVLLDDLHWSDLASVELLAHLARHTAGARVLLLGTYREAEVGPAHPVRRLAHSLHREGLTQAIPVRRLDRDATARLLTQRLDQTEVPTELSDLVHRHCDGNPFFTVEMLTALIGRGDLARVDGRWAVRELTSLGAPASISDAIGERVSRLSPGAQQALEAASVIGEVFVPEDVALVAAGEDGEDTLEKALDEAIAVGLLTVVEDHYAFDHSLTQQSLYAGLSPARRRRLHRLIGEGLTGRASGVQRRRAAEIARHLEEAGLPERALPFLLLAGDIAAELHSQEEAIQLYDRGLELAEELENDAVAASALERLGRVLLTTARYDESVEHLVRAAEMCRRLADVEGRLRVEGLLAQAQHRRGWNEAAAQRLAEVVAEHDVSIGASGPAPGVAALCMGLARVRLSLGQLVQSLEATDHAARLAREEGAVAVEADADAVTGTVLLFLDRPDDALAALEQAVALARSVDALTIESEATLALHWSLTMRGELDRSLELGERGQATARRAGDVDAEALHTANTGLTHFYRGDPDTALSLLERSVELGRAGSPTLYSGIPPAYLGLVHRARGDAAAARASYDEAATAPDLHTFAFGGYLDARQAELDLDAGDPASALDRLAPWLTEETPTRIHDVMLFTVAAEACLALGDDGRAEELAARALRRADATGNEVDGADARRVLGRCLLVTGRFLEARACLEEALARAAAIPYPAAEERIRHCLDELAHRLPTDSGHKA